MDPSTAMSGARWTHGACVLVCVRVCACACAWMYRGGGGGGGGGGVHDVRVCVSLHRGGGGTMFEEIVWKRFPIDFFIT